MTERAAVAKVSERGQTNIPASLRHRWGIDVGGEIGILDLGDAALILPGGLERARAEAARVLLDEGAYERAVADITDADLADQ